MSMTSSFVYGYGFNCDCAEDKLIEFVKNHKDVFAKSSTEKELYEEMLDYTANKYDLEDFFADYACDSTEIQGNGAVISNIMSRETGIRFSYYMADDDCGTPASVVFESGYPWQFNEKEVQLTESKLEEICKNYINELGIAEEPDHLELEFFG